MNKDKTQCPKGHLYEGENLIVYTRGDKQVRVCRQCKNAKANAYYHEKIKPVKHPGKPGRPPKKNILIPEPVIPVSVDVVVDKVSVTGEVAVEKS